MSCLFCSIAKKEVPAEVIYEDAEILAFLDVNPMAPGHTLVIPQKHVETILELPDSGLAPILRAVSSVERLILKTLHPQGFTLGVNQGKVSGQEVSHLHIHVVPRFEGDRGSSFQSLVRNIPKESIQVVASKIKLKSG